MTLLEVKNLAIQFYGSSQPTVEQLSFSVQKGETLAIVGESGSGKSITALSIMRLNPATHIADGTIHFEGNDITKATPLELYAMRGGDVGMIFQEPMTALNPLHTITKQIAETIALHQPQMRVDEVRARVRELLQEVGLDYLNQRKKPYPHQLSGGERQRVMIAMAIANRPKLLIADEPTTALDVTTQAHIMELLKELQKKYHMALILITHDLHVVRNIAHRVVVMRRGRLVESAPTQQLYEHPNHDYTKELLASSHARAPDTKPNREHMLIQAYDVSVSYASSDRWTWRKTTRQVLAPLSLEVAESETLGILGESGSGKTTLGLALARLLSAQGRVDFMGKNIYDMSRQSLREVRASVQFVFQDPYSSLNPRMTIEQILAEGLTIHAPHVSNEERHMRVVDMIEQVGLDHSALSRYPHEFSGGQRQRINIARAMIVRPRFVIFDEPTSALDITLQTHILALLKELQQRFGLGYVFISHDLHVIRSISHRVMVLQQGKVVESGDADKVLMHPQHPYTQSLVEASGML
ncbi:MAG: ABC transporter ATP-binding protein [Alphaproteobacteria bacterium]|nr:MAG: ABC transporter ATP-binding protein [Alphaproteobacteria bacterium]TAF40822.1 MAG: ABC transporter ATP-binding protein [Alphaproteobacteria bacterium]TAF77010.1 MAG: ABC transporter ATP-binding protein [Alphaproteobacteria bacterium]